MLVLFDNGTPRTLARFLIDHHMVTEARAVFLMRMEYGLSLLKVIPQPRPHSRPWLV